MTPVRSSVRLLCDHAPGRSDRAGWCGLGYRESEPGIPARRAVVGIEFAIPLQAEEGLIFSDRKNISDLRAKTEHARPEGAKNRVLAGVVSDLLIGVAYEPNKQLLRHKVRHAPVEMEIDAALIVGIRIYKVVGEAANAGEFIAGRRIKVGVTAAGIDGAVADTEIGKPHRIVVAHRNVAGGIDHVIVDSLVPLQL